MTSSEEHTFENNWRKAFDNADETPPASVWERVEARLDEEDDRVAIIPLWQQWQTLKWVAAAGVTILLVSLGTWWLSNNSNVKSHLATKVTNEKLSSKTGVSEKTSNPETGGDVAISKMQPRPNQGRNESVVSVTPSQSTDVVATRSVSAKSKSGSKIRLTKSDEHKTELPALYKEEGWIAEKQKDKMELPTAHLPSVVAEETAILSLSNSNSKLPAVSNPVTLSTPVLALSSLNSKEMHELIGLSKRQPWVAYQPVQSEQKVQKTAPKEYWASVGVMPASYNAGVAIGGSKSGLAYATSNQSFSTNTAQSSSSTNRPSFSYALQWQGGVQLAQRWSLETGLNYLQGNSVFEGTNGFNAFSNSYVNNLEAAINISDNSKQRYDFAAIGADKSQIQALTTSQNINNSYQFLQVPVQAGYAVVKPKRKLSLWLLAGFINNVFLRNSFQSGQESTVTVSGAGNPYRTLSFSAGAGMRIQYKMNKRWTTLLSGNFQRALGSNTRSGTAFEARPQLLGVGAGLRYGF
jgi:hypothetical protein